MDLYVDTLKGAIRTLEGKVERLQAVNTQQARDLVLLHLQLQAATDMAEALKKKCAAQDALIDELIEEDEPMLSMQVVVDRTIRPPWGRAN